MSDTLLTTSGIRERMDASGAAASILKDKFVTVEQ